MRIFLIRHGESQANVDRGVHQFVPDHDIALSNLGQEQAQKVGHFLKSYLKDHPNKPKFDQAHQMASGIFDFISKVNPELGKLKDQHMEINMRLWNSPYRRARETARILSGSIADQVTDKQEDVLLCEQQFGLFDGISREEQEAKFPNEYHCFMHQRKSSGKFWARCPQGESPFDVACRLRQFFETVHRNREEESIENIIIVCHGTVLRLFTMMWLNKDWEWFNNEPDPGNCAVRLLEDNQDRGYIYSGHRDGVPWEYKGNGSQD